MKGNYSNDTNDVSKSADELANVKWKIIPVEDGWFKIKSKHDSVLDS